MDATARMRCWLSEPTRASRLWLGKRCALAAWAGLLLAIITPPHGSGFSLCWHKASTGLPCVGCGITRSLSCGLRGMFAESFQSHPMGVVIVALFSFLALQSLLPASRRAQLKSYLEKRAVTFNSLYLAFVGAFLAFGIGRTLLQFSNHLPSCLSGH